MNTVTLSVCVEHRVLEAEYVIHILVAASQEYVNTYSTLRRHKAPTTGRGRSAGDPHRNVRLTPWALSPFLVGVLSAAAAIRKLPHTILTLVS